MKKVNLTIIKKWIAEKITAILGFDDDVVIGASFCLKISQHIMPPPAAS